MTPDNLYGWLVIVAGICTLIGAVLGNTKLAATMVHDVIRFIKRRPSRTKRLEIAVGEISDMLSPLVALTDEVKRVNEKVDAITTELPALRGEVSCRKADHRYVEDGMEVLMFAVMSLLEGNGSREKAKVKIREFVSVHHR